MASVTLSRLLELAVGTPEVGAVNFNILYRLLYAMLQKLDLSDHELCIKDLDKDLGTSTLFALAEYAKLSNSSSSPYHELERKVKWITSQLQQLSQLPTTMELSEQVRAQGDGENPLSSMWQYIKLKKNVDANEEGIAKLLSITADIMRKVEEMQDKISSILEKFGDINLKELLEKINDIDQATRILNERCDNLVQPDILSQFVTWNMLEDSLKGTPGNQFSDPHGNGYGSHIIRMIPEERYNFIDDIIKSHTLHQYLPRVNDNFLEMKPVERHELIENLIEKGTFQKLLPQHGIDLLKMNTKERANFLEDTFQSGILRNYLPGLDNDYEMKTLSERVKMIEDTIQMGTLHTFFPCKFQSLREMTMLQKRTSIESAIRNGRVEEFLPGVGIIFEKMDTADRGRFVETAAKSGLINVYEKASGKHISPIAEDTPKMIEKAIIKECQTLMYECNGTVETALANDIDSEHSSQEAFKITPKTHTQSSSRPGTSASRPCSRVSTPGTFLSSTSTGPSPEILDILDRLGALHDQHNKLKKLVKSLCDQLQEKVDLDNFSQIVERITILEDLLNKKVEHSDLDKFIEPLTILQEELRNKPSHTGRVSITPDLEDIDKLIEEKIKVTMAAFMNVKVASSPFTEELMERVGELEKRISLLEESLEVGRVIPHEQQSVVLSDARDSRYEMAERGSVTRDIFDMLADTANNGTDDRSTVRLKRLGLILDNHFSAMREKLSELDDDLKVMARGIELAIQEVKDTENRAGIKPVDEKKAKIKQVIGSIEDLAFKTVSKGKQLQGAESMQTVKQTSSNIKSFTEIDGDALHRAQNTIRELQKEIGGLQDTTKNIMEINTLRQNQIDDILKSSEELQERKADKDYVLGEFNVKADKRLLESKVNYSLFNKVTDEINKMVKEVEVKLEGNESAMKSFFHQLSEDVDGKLDRLEMDPLKGWIESRLKELNQKIAKAQPGWSDDDAAGLRKQLIQRFHCLSCDKTIDILPKNPMPSLPSQISMPNTRTPRPYTIFELNKIRQHASKGIINQNIMNFERALLEKQLARIRKSDLRTFLVHYSSELESLGLTKCVALAGNQGSNNYYARPRACGGLHTMTFPHRRTIRITDLNRAIGEEELKQGNITDNYQQCCVESRLQGADGVIYKGRCVHPEKINAPKGFKLLRKGTNLATIPQATSQPLPAPPSRPVSARNRSGSARSSSRSVSARPNTVHAIRDEEPIKNICKRPVEEEEETSFN